MHADLPERESDLCTRQQSEDLGAEGGEGRQATAEVSAYREGAYAIM